MQQSQFLGERNQDRLVLGHFTGEFHDERRPLKSLNVGKRFAKEIKSFSLHKRK